MVLLVWDTSSMIVPVFKLIDKNIDSYIISGKINLFSILRILITAMHVNFNSMIILFNNM